MRPRLIAQILLLAPALEACAGCVDGGLTVHPTPPIDFDEDGWTEDQDCNDSNADVNSDAVEVCDGVDNNCDGEIDEGLLDVWFVDADGDGYGLYGTAKEQCEPLTGWSRDSTDCDDDDRDVNPGEREICDGIDNNCDDIVDEEVEGTFYLDADGDGYGSSKISAVGCTAPTDYVDDDSDCDDDDAGISPDAREICSDSVDQDCDGEDETCRIFGPMELDRHADLSIVNAGTNQWVAYAEGAARLRSPALAFGDDLDGDGRMELLIGSPGIGIDGSDRVGTAYMVSIDSSVSTGIVDVDEAKPTGWTTQEIAGDTRDGWTGHAIHGPGDLDGDRLGDMLLGSPGMHGSNFENGVVQIFLASSLTSGAALNVQEADAQLGGSDRYGKAGYTLSGGDLDGDGDGDLVIAAPAGASNYAGRVYFLLSCPAGIAGCEDTDGDGVEEASLEWGAKDLFDMGTGGDGYLDGPNDGAGLGYGLAADMDFNADGHMDVWVSAPVAADAGSNAGASYLIDDFPFSSYSASSASAFTVHGAAANDYSGQSLASVGDVNADGYDDVAIGAPSRDSGTGQLYIILGRSDTEIGKMGWSMSLADADAIAIGEAAGDNFSGSIAAAGDQNGDGAAEILVGAPGYDGTGTDLGRTYMYWGPLKGIGETLTTETTLTGNADDGLVGNSLAPSEDMDGDGALDVLIGAPGYGDEGTVFLLWGGTE